MNMKRIFALLLMILAIFLAACGNETDDKTPKSTQAPAGKIDPQAETVKKIMDAMGEDLIRRAKDAGFSLYIDFQAYAPGRHNEEMKDMPEVVGISIELRSPTGVTQFNNFTLDTALMKEIQYALIDANVFDLTEEEKNVFKAEWFEENNRGCDLYVNEKHANMHMSDTPSGDQAVLYLRNIGHIPNMYYESWYQDYEWDVLVRGTKK